ncbi:MAG TPA: carbohydrate ABC transporter permease [Clostridiales bacterium]|nr:carbohydrate ABC transporter permease [Clostridia bacterium]HCS73808.1 carbohydrate ABC transporter permease [Clostridiales bacterium]
MKKSTGRIAFDIINYTILILFALTIILPFAHIIAISLSEERAVVALSVSFWPKGFDTRAYRTILGDQLFISSFVNSVAITAAVTLAGLLVNVMAAYCFSKEFFGKKVFNYYFILTMYFSGGLIPTYLWMTRYLKLKDSYLALILPALVSVYYIIVIRSQIETIPKSLTEAARIDGATEAQTLFLIVMPTIVPTLAAIGMFIALGVWNSWFNVMIYIDDNKKWTLQYYLRKIVIEKTITTGMSEAALKMAELGTVDVRPENYQNAAIILVALPIVCVYPFVQKYFVKGILVGSVKE